jgi:hypothetical protein
MGEMARAKAANEAKPNSTYWTPGQSRQADSMARQNNPLGRFGTKIENFLQLKQIAQQGAHMFDPRSKAGLANIAGMFVGGGAEGDATPAMESLGMKGQFAPYSHGGLMRGNALDRGITHETMGQNIRIGRQTGDLKDFPKGSQELLLRSLAERAQGVGRYKSANPGEVLMQKLEMARKQQVQNRADVEEGKQLNNRFSGDLKKFQLNKQMGRAFEAKQGGQLVQGSINNPETFQAPFMDKQPEAYTVRTRLLNLQKQNPGNELLGNANPLLQAIHDMLFSGKGLAKRPTRPGGKDNPSPFGTPYGGGPFG